MKLHAIDRSSLSTNSFTIRKNSYPNFLKMWHHHPELELVYILKSTGTRFIGDNIESFKEGDLFLLGKNLSHMWLNDEAYFKKDSKLKAEAIAIHFKHHFLGNIFFETPELQHINHLLIQSKQGIHFVNPNPSIVKQVKALVAKKGAEKLIAFISILNQLALHKQISLIASKSDTKSINLLGSKEMGKVYEYLFQNFNQTIKLNDVAALAHMNPSAFSRYFKRVNRKTLTRFINEIRIGYACKKLQEKQYNITEICYESGYNSISNFNKQFKAITKLSPSEYINKSKIIA